MELYSIELFGDSGCAGGFTFHNTYKVVANDIPSTVEHKKRKLTIKCDFYKENYG